jgi:UDP-N-acetylmuramate--alanine ligase
MLAELMRFRQCAGDPAAHGKTTTTSMVATTAEAGGLDPTVKWRYHQRLRTNARMGDGEWMVVEADESDGTFLKLPADIAVVTNIDPEHLDHYGSFDKVREAFRQFVENVPFYGFGDVHRSPRGAGTGQQHRRPRVITYGENAQADAVHQPPRRRCSLEFDVVIRMTRPRSNDNRWPAPADAWPP